ncbi:hypothetical protein F5051DRAFT_22398 [Lentinula edodes]|nr:hypothetical protein F5051DRAFT_22398 [Lentinula edodes]
MIFPNKFPFILLVMTTSLCCMRLLLSVHASPLGTTLKDRAQLNGGRIFLGYYYAWKETLATEIRKHDGFNVLVDHSLPISIQPSCVFEDTHPRQMYLSVNPCCISLYSIKSGFLFQKKPICAASDHSGSNQIFRAGSVI